MVRMVVLFWDGVESHVRPWVARDGQGIEQAGRGLMGSLIAGADNANGDVGPSVCIHGGLPEIPLQEGKGQLVPGWQAKWHVWIHWRT